MHVIFTRNEQLLNWLEMTVGLKRVTDKATTLICTVAEIYSVTHKLSVILAHVSDTMWRFIG